MTWAMFFITKNKKKKPVIRRCLYRNGLVNDIAENSALSYFQRLIVCLWIFIISDCMFWFLILYSFILFLIPGYFLFLYAQDKEYLSTTISINQSISFLFKTLNISIKFSCKNGYLLSPDRIRTPPVHVAFSSHGCTEVSGLGSSHHTADVERTKSWRESTTKDHTLEAGFRLLL